MSKSLKSIIFTIVGLISLLIVISIVLIFFVDNGLDFMYQKNNSF